MATDDRPNIEVVREVLYAWGEAIRGDWGGIDGRTCRSELQGLADLLVSPTPVTVEQAAAVAGVCPAGHWHEWCEIGSEACSGCTECRWRNERAGGNP